MAMISFMLIKSSLIVKTPVKAISTNRATKQHGVKTTALVNKMIQRNTGWGYNTPTTAEKIITPSTALHTLSPEQTKTGFPT